MLKRAYSLLTIKSINDDERIIEGIATTPSTDSCGDIVEPDGAEFTLPIPFLSQHDSKKSIGRVTHAKVTKAGIEIKAEIEKLDEPGSLKDRLDTAWQEIKLKLVRGLSIGFNPIEYSRLEDTFSYRFIRWRWLELSAVTIPANQDASITAIKAIDMQQRAALGQMRRHGVILIASPPGASGTSTGVRKRGPVLLIPRNYT